MTGSNKELAALAQRRARGADGLRRRALLVLSVALNETTSMEAARKVLINEASPVDVRERALALLAELTTEKESL